MCEARRRGGRLTGAGDQDVQVVRLLLDELGRALRILFRRRLELERVDLFAFLGERSQLGRSSEVARGRKNERVRLGGEAADEVEADAVRMGGAGDEVGFAGRHSEARDSEKVVRLIRRRTVGREGREKAPREPLDSVDPSDSAAEGPRTRSGSRSGRPQLGVEAIRRSASGGLSEGAALRRGETEARSSGLEACCSFKLRSLEPYRGTESGAAMSAVA